MRPPIPVTITKGKIHLHLGSQMEAARHIGVSKSSIKRAIRDGIEIKGWTVAKDTPKPTKDQQFKLVGHFEEKPRVKEIFTRKPFAATGIWRPKDECME